MIRAPEARSSLLWGLDALSNITSLQTDERIVVFDHASAALEAIFLVHRAADLIGTSLGSSREADALDAFRKQVRAVYASVGDGPLDEEFVDDPAMRRIESAAREALAAFDASDSGV
jgi:hypothetical protein